MNLEITSAEAVDTVCHVLKKSMSFKEDEYNMLSVALRDIAMRLIAHADEIDNAALEDPNSMR